MSTTIAPTGQEHDKYIGAISLDANIRIKQNTAHIIVKSNEALDDSKREFWAVISSDCVDRQKDKVTKEAMAKAMPIFMERGRLIYGHKNIIVGTPITWEQKYDEKEKVTKTYVKFKVYKDFPTDDLFWKGIKNGEITKFSVGGVSIKENRTCEKDPETGTIRCFQDVSEMGVFETSGLPPTSPPANDDASIVTASITKSLRPLSPFDEELIPITKELNDELEADMEKAGLPFRLCVQQRQQEGYSEKAAARICGAIKRRTIHHALQFGLADTAKGAISHVLTKIKDDKLFAYVVDKWGRTTEELELYQQQAKNLSLNPTPNGEQTGTPKTDKERLISHFGQDKADKLIEVLGEEEAYKLLPPRTTGMTTAGEDTTENKEYKPSASYLAEEKKRNALYEKVGETDGKKLLEIAGNIVLDVISGEGKAPSDKDRAQERLETKFGKANATFLKSKLGDNAYKLLPPLQEDKSLRVGETMSDKEKKKEEEQENKEEDGGQSDSEEVSEKELLKSIVMSIGQMSEQMKAMGTQIQELQGAVLKQEPPKDEEEEKKPEEDKKPTEDKKPEDEEEKKKPEDEKEEDKKSELPERVKDDVEEKELVELKNSLDTANKAIIELQKSMKQDVTLTPKPKTKKKSDREIKKTAGETYVDSLDDLFPTE